MACSRGEGGGGRKEGGREGGREGRGARERGIKGGKGKGGRREDEAKLHQTLAAGLAHI